MMNKTTRSRVFKGSPRLDGLSPSVCNFCTIPPEPPGQDDLQDWTPKNGFDPDNCTLRGVASGKTRGIEV
jgi:hypothetical protein